MVDPGVYCSVLGLGSLLRSGGRRGPKEPDPDTPPLMRVLPGTGGTGQYLFENKHLPEVRTGEYSARSNTHSRDFNNMRRKAWPINPQGRKE